MRDCGEIRFGCGSAALCSLREKLCAKRRITRILGLSLNPAKGLLLTGASPIRQHFNMRRFNIPRFFLKKGASSFHHILWVVAIALALGIGPATQAWQEARIEQVQTENISTAEFSR